MTNTPPIINSIEEIPWSQTSMLHGTCVEAAIRLLEYGKLPGPKYPDSSRKQPVYNGYLYFFPNPKAFADHPLRKSIDLPNDKRKITNMARALARGAERDWFAQMVIGMPYTSAVSAKYDVPASITEYADEAADLGVDIKRLERMGIERLIGRFEECKGVVIGLGREAKKYATDHSDKCHVEEPGEDLIIYAPDGLDARLVNFVLPMGSHEKKMLASRRIYSGWDMLDAPNMTRLPDET